MLRPDSGVDSGGIGKDWSKDHGNPRTIAARITAMAITTIGTMRSDGRRRTYCTPFVQGSHLNQDPDGDSERSTSSDASHYRSSSAEDDRLMNDI